MSSFLKKFSLKHEYLKLELEEIQEQAEKFNLEWNKLFGKYFVDKNSTFWVNEETGEIRKDKPEEDNKQSSSKKIPDKLKKLYKKLSTFTHPDKGGSVEEFTNLKKSYEKEDLIELLKFAGQYGVDYELDESDKLLLEKSCVKLEKKFEELKTSLPFVYFTGSIGRKKAVIKMMEHQYGFKIKEEDYPKELLES